MNNWHNMSWTEASKLIQGSMDNAILPLGATEQHGAYFNMSQHDLETGRNLFACGPKDNRKGLGLTQRGYNFIAGVIKHGRALCVAFSPTVNSYKRLVRQGGMSYFSWVPVFNAFGSSNRTNSIRVPMNGGRCYSRNADGTVNPYLAAALALAAGLQGIRGKIEPGKPQDDNRYESSESDRQERGIEFLPQTLLDAIGAFLSDPFVEQVLGSTFKGEFVKYKLEEWESYHQPVSQWEIDRYSHLF